MRVEGERPGDWYLRPDPRHPLHPFQKLKRERPKIKRWLESDPELKDFVERKEPSARQTLSQFRAQAVAGRHDPTLWGQGYAFLGKLVDDIWAASTQRGSHDIPEWAKFHFLIEQIVPPELVGRWLTGPESVFLFIAPMGDVQRIHMTFTGASQNERGEYEDLIRKAQEHFGHRKDQGGRKRREEQHGSDPRFIARLRFVQERSPADVACILHLLHPEEEWLRPYETGEEERVARRVARYAEDGNRALREEVADNWAERERSGRPSPAG